MTAQILTQDLGDGYYLHQLNIQTYYYCETITSPVSLRESRAGKIAYAPIRSDFGQNQRYRLSHFVQKEDLQKQKGQVVKLASVQKGKLKASPQAIAIFNKYPDHDIAFVGNYGRRKAGKSFWYDKILNLSDFSGNNYSRNKGSPGLYMWSIPYSKDNLKFFLIDYAGFQGKDQLSSDEEKLLDLELLLSEKLVIVPEPNDDQLTVLKPAYNHLLQSQRRFSDKGIQANKFSSYWPNQIYTLYRSPKPVKKQIDKIGILFDVYNFSIIHDALDTSKSSQKQDLLKSDTNNNLQPVNQKYVKMTSLVFQDIFDKMKGKQYGNITFTGKNLPHILEKSSQSINSGRGVKIDQIYQGAKGSIYDEAIEKSKVIYLNQVRPLRENKNPKPLDVLTDTFQRGSAKAFKQFDKEIVDPKARQQYESKLQAQIDKIEDEILKQNKKRTQEFYNNKLPNGQAANPTQYFKQLKTEFQNQKKSTLLDHNDLTPVEKRLQQSLIIQPEIILLPQTEKQRYQELKKLIGSKKKQLDQIKQSKVSVLKGGHNSIDGSEIYDKHQAVITKSAILKKQLDETKQLNDLTPQQRQNMLKSLRQVHKTNEDVLINIKNKIHNEQQINNIKDRIRKAAHKNTLLQSGLSQPLNKYKSNLSNRSKSVIRDIKQENIKKVTIK